MCTRTTALLSCPGKDGPPQEATDIQYRAGGDAAAEEAAAAVCEVSSAGSERILVSYGQSGPVKSPDATSLAGPDRLASTRLTHSRSRE